MNLLKLVQGETTIEKLRNSDNKVTHHDKAGTNGTPREQYLKSGGDDKGLFSHTLKTAKKK